MGLLGGIFKITGTIVGKTSEIAFKGAGEIIGAVADGFGADSIADASREIGNGLGDFSNGALIATGNGVGTVIDTALDIATELGGGIGESVAESMGATQHEIENGRKIGSIIGGAAAGLLVGDVIGAGITTVTAATATASTGVAISSLHGVAQTSATLAQIGGGTIAAGGGGVAAGTAILNGINVISAADGARVASTKTVNNTYHSPEVDKIKNLTYVNSEEDDENLEIIDIDSFDTFF